MASKQDLVPTQMSADELWHETQELFDAAAYYMDGLMFATMGASAGSEMLLTRAYNKLAKQDGDPDATTLLMGWDNIPVRSEKSLYDLAMWIREDKNLTDYILNTPSHELAEKLDARRFCSSLSVSLNLSPASRPTWIPSGTLSSNSTSPKTCRATTPK